MPTKTMTKMITITSLTLNTKLQTIMNTNDVCKLPPFGGGRGERPPFVFVDNAKLRTKKSPTEKSMGVGYDWAKSWAKPSRFSHVWAERRTFWAMIGTFVGKLTTAASVAWLWPCGARERWSAAHTAPTHRGGGCRSPQRDVCDHVCRKGTRRVSAH